MTTIRSGEAHRGASRGGGVRDVLRTRLELWLVIAFMALTFAAGVTVGMMGQPSSSQAVVSASQQEQLPVAPPLTDEQIQAGLPADHPGIDEGSSAQGSGKAAGTKAGASGSGSSDRSPSEEPSEAP